MAEIKDGVGPANWQVTATTMDCNLVNGYVTILVYKDWSSKCTWWATHKSAASQDPKHKFPKEIKAKIQQCQGPDCKVVIGYRDKFVHEEKLA